jgi:hypothetical protein
MILVSSLLLSISVTTPDKNQAFARCPNGTHKSPSGDCETVVPHVGFPRCPNGLHRSPGGTCEQVGSSENSGGGGSSNIVPPSPFAESNNNNPVRSSMSESASGRQCDQSLWNHIYNPQRLQVVDSCKTEALLSLVTGASNSR